MSDYPRLDPNGLLYYSQQLKQKIEDAVPGDMTGATSSENGEHGLVPQPNAGQEGLFLKGNGTWSDPNDIKSISVNNTPVSPDANKNVNITIPNAPVQSISKNGTALTPDAQGNVNITVPTTTSELTNNSDYQTGTDVQNAIDDALADFTGVDFEVVQTLPATGEKGIFYLVPIEGETNNIYDEYVWVKVGGTTQEPVYGFEKIGTTQVDLSGYVQRTEMTTISNSQIDDIIETAFA